MWPRGVSCDEEEREGCVREGQGDEEAVGRGGRKTGDRGPLPLSVRVGGDVRETPRGSRRSGTDPGGSNESRNVVL